MTVLMGQAAMAKVCSQGQGNPYRQAAEAKAILLGTLPTPLHAGLTK